MTTVISLRKQFSFYHATGPGKAIYKVGEAGKKGHEGSEEKLYCQVCFFGMEQD